MNDQAAGFSVGDSPAGRTLFVARSDYPATAREVRDLLAGEHMNIFDRGGIPAVLAHPAEGGPPKVMAMSVHHVVNAVHEACQPMAMNKNKKLEPVTLPERVAKLYLALRSHRLRPLAGVTSAPLLHENGRIVSKPGYDRRTMTWCEAPPKVEVPTRPTRAEALDAYRLLRRTFRTFPFAGAVMIEEGKLRVVDQSKPAGLSEAAVLCGVITAIARPSLDFAPGLLLVAPEISGSGTGKGLLARAIFEIAYDWQPAAITGGHDPEEREKRIASVLIEALPGILLDNLNSKALSSDTLASALTERPAMVRAFGSLRSVPIYTTTFLCITGNGLSASEDLMRRMLLGELDAGCEDPELRPFSGNFLADITEQRPALLSAALTVWRYGRQNEATITPGLPLGGFETWCRWVRNPLLNLGCPDPVLRLQAAKATDPRRVRALAILSAWHGAHSSNWLAPSELAEPVLRAMETNKPLTRQAIAALLQRMVRMRVGGFVLQYQEDSSAGKRAGTYRVVKASADGADGADAFHPPHESSSDVNHMNGETHPHHPHHPHFEAEAPPQPEPPEPHPGPGSVDKWGASW